MAAVVDNREGAAMIRLACDSDELAKLVECPVVLTYSDLVPDAAALKALEHRFPDSEVGLIDRGLGDPTGQATIADIETGTLALAQVTSWLAGKRHDGWSCLTIYGSFSTLAQVDREAGPHKWWRWFARWGTTLQVPGHPGAMLQFDSDGPEHLDWSIIRNPHWHPRARG
ncbi:MAG: hypothetical protein ACRDPD_06985 [Streptosporangiaceae bacterium]